VRLFVAVDIDEPVRDAAARAIEALQHRVSVLAPAARITWVAPVRLHLTVRFIGAATEAAATAIVQALQPPLFLTRFEMSFSGIGTFPLHGPPRVIWAGVTAGGEPLALVEREVTARLSRVGVPPEGRSFNPHLTLARVRDATGLRARGWLEGLADHAFGTTRVGAITLFESRSSPKGPTYVAVQTTALSK
jgi:2'-5' RNA ligase